MRQTSFIGKFEPLIKKLDLIGSIVGCLIGVVAIFIGSIIKVNPVMEIGAAILVASFVYLFYRKKLSNLMDKTLFPPNKSLTLSLNIIFFIAFTSSIFIAHTNLHRPQLYFLLIAICVTAIATETLFSQGKIQIWFILVKIILVSVNLNGNLLYEFPGLYGVDPWVHMSLIETWANEGHIIAHAPMMASASYGYYNYPIFHLIVIVTKILTGLEFKESLFLSVGIFYVVASSLFVFLISKNLLGIKGGLLAALLMITNMFYISWGAWLIPTSLGVVFFAIILYLIFVGRSDHRKLLLLITMVLILVRAHTLSPFVIICALITIYLSKICYERVYKVDINKINIGFNFIIIFVVAMLSQWIYAFYTAGSRTFIDSVLSGLFQSVRTEIEFTGKAFSFSNTLDLGILAPLNRVGFLISMALIVIGTLFWLNPSQISKKKIALISATVVLSIFTYFPIAFGLKNLIAGRWPVFIYIVSAPIISQGVLLLSRYSKIKIAKLLFLVFLIFIYSMFMINQSAVNLHTPFYGEYSLNPERNAYTQSELQAVDTISRIYNGSNVTTDNHYARLVFPVQIGYENIYMLDTKVKNDGIIVLRNYVYIHPYDTIINYDELNQDFLLQFEGSEYNIIYDNRDVQAYKVE